ncbi:MAG: tryptophanase [Clostridiales bacterium]|jgi:tryptophanase|nr:tryptophanase [Clostridiales bacterium]
MGRESKYVAEPFRIKMVETISVLSREERERKIAEAHFNPFYLRAEDVYIDLMTDSGTNAMSAAQWSALIQGDEAYAGARSFFKFEAAGKDIFGYDFIMPVHQGRAAEKVLFSLLLSKGQYAVSNMFFDTTRAHVELAGARAIDCVTPEAKDPQIRAPFKGNMDVACLEALIAKLGARQIGMVNMTITNNSAGGQPVSLDNIRSVAGVCKKHGIHLNIDAARFAENAYFVKQREPACQDMTIKQIIREMFSFADTFTMSAKKDAIVNIGGIVGINDGSSDLVIKSKANCISYEGFTTYGGLAGRDLEAIAVGLYEGIDEEFLSYRIGQMEYLAACFDEEEVVYQAPVGGHGVFVDAAAMFPQIPYDEFPGMVLGTELYKEAGIRATEIGSYMLGNDPDTGKQLKSEFEFLRLAIPRRVYTRSHLDVVVEAMLSVKKRAPQFKRGMRITWEPPILRHFQAHLSAIEK